MYNECIVKILYTWILINRRLQICTYAYMYIIVNVQRKLYQTILQGPHAYNLYCVPQF